jgi:hypothetical protein
MTPSIIADNLDVLPGLGVEPRSSRESQPHKHYIVCKSRQLFNASRKGLHEGRGGAGREHIDIECQI